MKYRYRLSCLGCLPGDDECFGYEGEVSEDEYDTIEEATLAAEVRRDGAPWQVDIKDGKGFTVADCVQLNK